MLTRPIATTNICCIRRLLGAWPLEELDAAGMDSFRAAHPGIHAEGDSRGEGAHLVDQQQRAYEQAMHSFVRRCCRPSGESLSARVPAVPTQGRAAGSVNSLSQVLLKLTVPGVPDVYQGTELWAFTWSIPTIAARSTTRTASGF